MSFCNKKCMKFTVGNASDTMTILAEILIGGSLPGVCLWMGPLWFSLNIFYCQILYSNGIEMLNSQVIWYRFLSMFRKRVIEGY